MGVFVVSRVKIGLGNKPSQRVPRKGSQSQGWFPGLLSTLWLCWIFGLNNFLGKWIVHPQKVRSFLRRGQQRSPVAVDAGWAGGGVRCSSVVV